jgi:predicted dehydrogenase
MEQCRIGIVGAGFAARLHADAWRRVAGIDVQLVAVASQHRERAERFAAECAVAEPSDSVTRVMERDDIDVIDICAPNVLHADLAVGALNFGKHVVVEKPLTGCFDLPTVTSPPEMLDQAVTNAERIVAKAAEAGRVCCYAENWVYAPPFTKAAALLREAGGTILRIQAEESHSGTHSEPNKHWVSAGGGALLGKGCHPLGAALYLKREEGMRTIGRPILPQSVVAETRSLTKLERFGAVPTPIRTGYEDVEDFGIAIVTFDDGSVAEIVGADTTLGGVRNLLTAYATNVVVEANLNPNSAVRAYAPDGDVLAGAYLSEKLETHAGWTQPSPDEDWMQGYPAEMQDFAEAIVHGRAPRSDAVLGRDVVAVVYGAYVAAAEGRRVDLSDRFADRGAAAGG